MEFTQRSNVLLMNLWGRKGSPCLIPPPSSGFCFNFSRQRQMVANYLLSFAVNPKVLFKIVLFGGSPKMEEE